MSVTKKAAVKAKPKAVRVHKVTAKPLKMSERPLRMSRPHPTTLASETNPIDTNEIENFLDFFCHLEKRALAIFSIQHMTRRMLPYGIWTCKSGREVLFNREYQPIAQRINGVVSYADRDEYVDDIEKAVMLYNDVTDPVRYLTKHLGYMALTPAQTKASRKSLLVCLQVMREFTPAESSSVNKQWSLLDHASFTKL